MADRYWPGQSAIGKRISLSGGKEWDEVAGVVEDSKYKTLGEPPTSYVYLPLLQHIDQAGVDEMNLLVRSRDPEKMVQVLRRQLAELDPNLPVLRAKTLHDHMAEILLPQRMGATLLGSFSLLALALAGLGIYGLLSYFVSLRIHEIGVRMALGAGRREILRMVLRHSLLPICAGVAVGLVIAFWATRLIAGFLFGVSGLDPATFALMAALMTGVAVAACYLPAFRASRINPTIALRQT
jgi:putative ABC transport system permease protein